MPKPVVLCILDGWGIGANPAVSAPAQAQVPTFNHLWAACPHATLTTFGPDVGLPTGQMGNSEVGHTNIGAGRIVAMDLGQIDLAIEDGSFAREPALRDFIATLKASGGVAHLAGLCSPGGVHAHQAHVLEAARVLTAEGIPVAVHVITDGRDVPPQSGAEQVAALEAALPAGARIATVTGRYYAMDRDNRWERVETAYRAMVQAQGAAATSAGAAIAAGYAIGVTDEFLPATVIGSYPGMQDSDGLFFLNFRADRAREILSAIGAPAFTAFDRPARPHLVAMLGMVDYSTAHNAFMTAVFPKKEIVNTLGEWVSAHGRTQFRLAETEKYPHVTFFLNGGREVPYPGEDRAMPASPKVATYDLQPEMSADQVSDRFVEAIEKGYDLIVVNFANPDMVGHTGSLPAAIRACEAVDRGLTR
ncbi:MAG: 2,3-bisphosphoglycerate-independent phosphoglycerate mutase, partial [Tabrizicola sp.]|nr:2,3-bisphosphoglycerate-independent phosphoglycerate mutase [Tabrizicola sp.]